MQAAGTIHASTIPRPASVSSSRILAEWAAENPRSRALHERAREALPGGLAHDIRRADPFPLAVVRAEGARKWDADGHELVCYVMGHGALLLGHGHPAVVEAVRRQAEISFHPGACHPLEAEWAEEVVRLVPSAEHVRFTSSGTEATLLALAVARAITGRPRVVKLEGHFHGWHETGLAGADPPFQRPPVGSPVAVAAADVATVERELARADVACLILEPSGASWGAVPLPEGFLARTRELTRAYGTLLIFDEVVTGFRWAPGGLQERGGVIPDLTALAKILAGGMPGGALAGSAELMEVLSFREEGAVKVTHYGTHNAHPLAAGAGCATLRLVADGSPQAHADAHAAALRAGMNDVLARRGAPGIAYGESSTFHLMLGIDRPVEALPAETLKRGVGDLNAQLECAMLLGGVHLFHGGGLVSAAHGEADLDRTLVAFDVAVTRLQAEALIG